MRKYYKNIFFIIVIVVGILNFYACGEEELKGRELAAYNLILEASYEFKDPSSVRVISGQLTGDIERDQETLDAGFFVISAKNTYGARTTERYLVSHYDGELLVEKYSDLAEIIKLLTKTTEVEFNEKCDKKDDFNIDKVNAALNKKWENIS